MHGNRAPRRRAGPPSLYLGGTQCQLLRAGAADPQDKGFEAPRIPAYPPKFLDELESIDERGHVAVPQGPGLGVEMDWEYINAHHLDTISSEGS